jgi:hypothetical protein
MVKGFVLEDSVTDEVTVRTGGISDSPRVVITFAIFTVIRGLIAEVEVA